MEANDCKRFYTEYCEKWECGLSNNHILPDELGVTEVENGIVLPLLRRKDIDNELDGCYKGGVCTDEFQFVGGLARHRADDSMNYSCSESYTVAGDVIFRDETVIFGGILFRHFGHNLIDGMARLWYFAENRDTTYKLVFLIVGKHEFVSESILNLLGLTEDRFEIITAPTQFAKIIVPDEAIYMRECAASRSWLKAYDVIKETVARTLPASTKKKIYLTRTALKDVDGINEEYFEEFYRARGFDIVPPETLSLAEQVNLIMNAEEIVCTMGTLSHLALFAKDGMKLTILLRLEINVIPVQLMINKLRNLDWYIVEATANALPTSQSRGMYFYAPNRYFREFLQDYGDDIEEDYVNDGYIKRHFYAYFKAWSQHYSDKRWYKKISEKNVDEIVHSTNKVFCKEIIDLQELSPLFTITEKKMRNCENIDLLKKELEAGLPFKVEQITKRGRQLEWSGKFSIPFFDIEGKQYAVELYKDNWQNVPLSTIAVKVSDIQKTGSVQIKFSMAFKDIAKAMDVDRSIGFLVPRLVITSAGVKERMLLIPDEGLREQMTTDADGNKCCILGAYRFYIEEEYMTLKNNGPALFTRVRRRLNKIRKGF